MAESKTRLPLLMDELQTHERVMLGQTTNSPGFKILDKLFEAVLVRATQDMVKLDPEESDYERKLSVRTLRSRYFNECIKLIRDSIDHHLDTVRKQSEQENVEAVDAVSKVFGIHPAKPKDKK